MYHDDLFDVDYETRAVEIISDLDCVPDIHNFSLSYPEDGLLSFRLERQRTPLKENVDKNHWSNKVVSVGTLSDFFNCCGIIIGSCFSNEDITIDIAIELAERMGYGLMLYAIAEHQDTLKDKLLSKGFVEGFETMFTNIRSDNNVVVLSKKLNPV